VYLGVAIKAQANALLQLRSKALGADSFSPILAKVEVLFPRVHMVSYQAARMLLTTQNATFGTKLGEKLLDCLVRLLPIPLYHRTVPAPIIRVVGIPLLGIG
jgi:hypothetical protein